MTGWIQFLKFILWVFYFFILLCNDIYVYYYY